MAWEINLYGGRKVQIDDNTKKNIEAALRDGKEGFVDLEDGGIVSLKAIVAILEPRWQDESGEVEVSRRTNNHKELYLPSETETKLSTR